MTMRKTYVCFATAIAVLCLASCSFVSLSPAKSGGSKAALSLSLGMLQADASGTVSRAIVQGGGYLYIRTIGGPTGNSGPFYGPYPVSAGGTFTTEDIPAGSYDMIGFFYSATALDESKSISVGGSTYTFRQLMSLDDSRFTAIADSDSDSSGDSLGDFFAGQVCGEKVDSVELKAGETTPISVTLIPFTGSANTLDLSSVRSMAIASSDGIKREFFELHGLEGSASAKLSCAITPSASGATLGIVALYDNDGKLLSSMNSSGAISSTTTFTSTLPSGSNAYLYIEYKAASLQLDFSGSAIPGFTFSFAGNASFAGKKLFFGVYDVTDVSVVSGGGPQGSLAGFGLITLDSGGAGTGSAYSTTDFAKFSPAIPAAGKKYLVTAYVDMNGAYSTISSMYDLSAALMDAIEPNHGDYATSTANTVTATSRSATCSLGAADLSQTTGYTYYVTNSGSGTGSSGLSTCTLASAITKANADGVASKIKLLENVSLATALTVSSDLAVYSSGSSRKTVTLSGTNVLSSFVTIDTASTLTLYYMAIDGTGMTMDSISNVSSPILVTTGSVLDLEGDAQISNITSTRMSSCLEGSAIFANGGSVFMNDSAITNCTNTALTANGGAVCVSSGTLEMRGTSKISNCTANTQGGAVYVDSGTMKMYGTSSIAECHITVPNAYGGGVYVNSGAFEMHDATTITNCSTTMEGGGLNIKGSFSMDGTSKISGCSADLGGGVYAGNGIAVYLAPTIAITGNHAVSNGGGVWSDNVLNNSGSNAGIYGNTSGNAGAENLYEAM